MSDTSFEGLNISDIDLAGIDFDGLEVVAVADGLGMPEMGASVSTCSCGSSSTCCSCYSCYDIQPIIDKVL